MTKTKKVDKAKRRRRTSLEIEEEQSRTLYIRIPHTIKKENEVRSLFFGEFKLKIPRQSSRYCHVIFSSIEEKVKNLKALKKKEIDGRPIFACPPKPINLEKKKKTKQKKIVIPEPTDDPRIGKYLFVSNIPPGVKASEIRDAFAGSVTVCLLKGLVKGSRQAKVKMSSTEACLQYSKNESLWPMLRGKKVVVALPKKSKKNTKLKKPKNKKDFSLRIYDGEKEITDVFKTDNESEEKEKTETFENEEDEDDDSEYEDIETESEVEDDE